HPGLDVTREIRNVVEHGLGDVVLTGAPDAPDGLAICHCGPGSEAGSGACFVKFGAVRPGAGGEERFGRLLDACADLTRRLGLERIVAGVNTPRRLPRGPRARLACAVDRDRDAPARRPGLQPRRRAGARRLALSAASASACPTVSRAAGTRRAPP
ncbi:MAG TPA: hypothetical protein VKH82_08725, partial [Candidatus Binatia bacterium]|nr:hypothetical protein [Candidatus Binatia bacterium]